MMTTTDRLTALDQIEKGIIADGITRLTKTALLDRIFDYCDNPDIDTDDITAIYSTAKMIDLVTA